ncbi:hypothetical protein O9992_30165 [Vibrio lentus]|nr:hypothetical protein [Vibrio lentus]
MAVYSACGHREVTAVVPNSLDSKLLNKHVRTSLKRQNLISSKLLANEGYNIPYTVEEYSWGSNSNLVSSIFLIFTLTIFLMMFDTSKRRLVRWIISSK